ncbi:MAG TPA: primosomal protein N' [Polyangiales bacterium]|nr:primosomal protein N' [Polyangiales bacterium]
MSSGSESELTLPGFAAPERIERCVQVAVPVPLRRVFTYSVPSALVPQISLGVRVAVPFGARKLAAYVVADEVKPDPEMKVRPIAAVLDTEPVFPPELFTFLLSAADYYMHPLGEVLRVAAPALSSRSVAQLRAAGFLTQGETLPGRRVTTRMHTVVCARVEQMPEARMGQSQTRLLARVIERREVALSELRTIVKNARGIAKAFAEKGLVSLEERELPTDRFFANEVAREQPPQPTAAQARAIEAVLAKLGQGGGFLLHGVTGSGKTEVYLRIIAEARARGLGSLMLVPEIALTPQLVARFRARFGDELAVLHSELTEKERAQAWQALRSGEVNLAIGARSALFAPVQSLGVIIVDEEHDASFKQEEGFRYQARDLALLRAHRTGALCVLGSATPSLESFQLAEAGKLTYLQMPERANAKAVLPPIEIVDLNNMRSGPTGAYYLSAPLMAALRESLEQGEQSILFLNRRGFAPSMRCNGCGELLECPACSVSLTKHRRVQRLRCHYCDFNMAAQGPCLRCGSAELAELGLGTERLEDELQAAFPNARVGRLDRDTAASEGAGKAIERLRSGEIDILVGTQMVTKGHDIPNVTVVGVILADQTLAFPDFRAHERTFQLLTQVAGRAGRGARPGRVFFQTFQPEHASIVAARSHDYASFCRWELQVRRELLFPPFSRLAAIRVDAGDEGEARRVCTQLADLARRHPLVRTDQVQVLGPAPAPIERLRARYRYRFLLRSAERGPLRKVAAMLSKQLDEGVAPARATLDIDPYSML